MQHSCMFLLRGACFVSFFACSVAYQSNGRRKQLFRQHVEIPPLPSENPDYAGSLSVLYTNDPDAARQWAEEYVYNRRPLVVGWDMESAPSLPWRESRYTGPATVQISVIDAALVLQIAQEDTGPYIESIPFLRDILEDSRILKAGVGIDQDMIELIQWPEKQRKGQENLWGQVVGRFDMGGIGASSNQSRSLKMLGLEICGVTLDKTKKISRSNWAASPRLERRQLQYAARDAWVAAAVVQELQKKSFQDQFSIEKLSDLVLKDEALIHELVERAAARKEAKTKQQALLMHGDEKIRWRDLPDDKLKDFKRLDAIIRDLKPPSAIVFDISNDS